MNLFSIQKVNESTRNEKSKNQEFSWLISADKIFESKIKDYINKLVSFIWNLEYQDFLFSIERNRLIILFEQKI